jgi:uncharacterized protein YbjT (DUF2867 family)
MPSAPIAVTGATGGLGGRVARRLAGRGVPIRLIVRDPGRAPELPGAEVAVTGGYDDAEGMRRALDGTSAVFLVSASEAPDRMKLHAAAVDAVAAAGVEKVVYTSFLGARPDCTFTFGRHHWHTEELIRRTGTSFTFLRDSLYLDFLPFMTGADPADVHRATIKGPAGDGRVSAVSRDDIADSAAAVLLAEGDAAALHHGRTYDMTGPEALTLDDVARIIGEVSGHPVTYKRETMDEAYASRASYGAPAFELEGWITTYTAIANGEVATVSDDVARLTGHDPADLAGFMRAHPESYAHLTGS